MNWNPSAGFRNLGDMQEKIAFCRITGLRPLKAGIKLNPGSKKKPGRRRTGTSISGVVGA